MNILEQIAEFDKQIEAIEEKRGELHWRVRDRARKHASFLSKLDNKRGWRYRVPDEITDVEVDEDRGVVTIHGVRYYSGSCDSESWTMPLDYALADDDPELWAERLMQRQRDTDEADRKAMEQAREKADRKKFEELRKKFEEAKS